MFITEGFGQAVGGPIEGFEGVGPVHYFAESVLLVYDYVTC